MRFSIRGGECLCLLLSVPYVCFPSALCVCFLSTSCVYFQSASCVCFPSALCVYSCVYFPSVCCVCFSSAACVHFPVSTSCLFSLSASHLLPVLASFSFHGLSCCDTAIFPQHCPSLGTPSSRCDLISSLNK